MLTHNQIREEFLHFFEKKNHKILPSSSLIPPEEDKTLLLTNAGMVQFKPIFKGEVITDYTRAATCQKCVRIVDIDKVGETERHLTFFEMLGNFSFGDYFKEAASEFAWEYLTEVIKLPKEKLYVSIYSEDDEAYNIWCNKIKIPSHKIYRFGMEDNFWSSGITGPCGPCSEIYYDLGKGYGCGKETCSPECDCDRFIELWNLVFMQYTRDEKGLLHELPAKNIDTGMGLERLAFILQNTTSLYKTDLFLPIINYLEDQTNTKYEDKKNVFKIIADHIRCAVFLIADGVLPSNEDRGYVLRRIIRHALYYVKELNLPIPFLNKIVPIVSKIMQDIYPEVLQKQDFIFKIIEQEEFKFLHTIEQGLQILDKTLLHLVKSKKNELPADETFRLYDTYGIPFELIKKIATEKGFNVNQDSFEKELDKQRTRSREAQGIIIDEKELAVYKDIASKTSPTEFLGYSNITEIEAKVLYIITPAGLVTSIKENDTAEIVCNKTIFYPQGGGQVGDCGFIYKDNKLIAEIYDTQKIKNDVIVHQVKMKTDELKVSDVVRLVLDKPRRDNITKHHTATHLLHASLRKVLGDVVRQSGSEVTADRLRFDFTFHRALTSDEIKKVEEELNNKIIENIKVEIYNTKLEEALKNGAIALFEDKYKENVRVVKIGNFSMELCGGTHAKRTGDIGLCKIIKEEAIASGIRRIEAKAASYAFFDYCQKVNLINNLSQLVQTPEDKIYDRIEKLILQLEEKDKELKSLKTKIINQEVQNLINKKQLINSTNIIITKLKDYDIKELRQMGDLIKDKLKQVIIVLASVIKEKIIFMAMQTENLKEKNIMLQDIIKEIARITSGNGGGKWNKAEGGGKDITSLDEALNKAYELVSKKLK